MRKVVFSITLLFIWSSVYANFCEIDGQLRNVAKEIEGPVVVWTKETGVALSRETQLYMINELCKASRDLNSERHVDYSALSVVYKSAVNDFLNLELDGKSQSRTISSLLRQHLSTPGLARKVPYQLSRISIRYKLQPDTLLINNQVEDSSAREFFVRPGVVNVRATSKSNLICSNSYNVAANALLYINCGDSK